MMLDHVHKLSLRCVVNGNDTRSIFGSMRHRCSACIRADGAIPLTKHFLTVKNDPYPVLLQFTRRALNLNVLNSYDTLLD